ncbi:hypothetical protein GCM10022259_40220 [Aquimarina mytili]
MSNTKRDSIDSKVLGITKSYQVFLPESYNYTSTTTYPVVYLIDGDYNFYYQTGIIESLSNIAEKIPELIVVGISDNGNEEYKKNCTPKTNKNPDGNSENFIKYIEEELKPKIEKQYKVSPFQILVGHSLGGLFATHVFLDNPTLFSAYIVIDPSYWWSDYEIITKANNLLKNSKEINSHFFVTVASTKQMGVFGFVDVLDKYYPNTKYWDFKRYENENHGSVGLVSVRDGLLKIFENFQLSKEQFYQLETANQVIDHFKKQSKKYNTEVRIPPMQLSKIIYYYFRKDKFDELKILEEGIATNFSSSTDDYYAALAKYLIQVEKLKEAQVLLEKSITSNPNAFKSYEALSKLYFIKKEYEKAMQLGRQSVQIAKQLKVRQWQINELVSNVKKIALKK